MNDADMWVPQPLPPNKLLTSLRTFVKENNHKRRPSWRFRIAPDLALQLQPRPPVLREDGGITLFDGIEASTFRP